MTGVLLFFGGLSLGTCFGLVIGGALAAGAVEEAVEDAERAFALAQQADHDALDREAEALARETRTVVE